MLAGALTAFATTTIEVLEKSLNFDARTQNLVIIWTAIMWWSHSPSILSCASAIEYHALNFAFEAFTVASHFIRLYREYLS